MENNNINPHKVKNNKHIYDFMEISGFDKV